MNNGKSSVNDLQVLTFFDEINRKSRSAFALCPFTRLHNRTYDQTCPGESIIAEYGTGEVLSRLSDPFGFQSLGAVLGMDWQNVEKERRESWKYRGKTVFGDAQSGLDSKLSLF
ncbi:DUF763 domain-containing protein [Pedobacter gandavensis]|uniref:DUF763 domain-containing protein n=1 Tax=Pedobacter gandavensis TaxID=2679963 RepID=UPI002930EA3A|nr:DUF763 domain-containing protein [Pedobacter gandavensis]